MFAADLMTIALVLVLFVFFVGHLAVLFGLAYLVYFLNMKENFIIKICTNTITPYWNIVRKYTYVYLYGIV